MVMAYARRQGGDPYAHDQRKKVRWCKDCRYAVHGECHALPTVRGLYESRVTGDLCGPLGRFYQSRGSVQGRDIQDGSQEATPT